MNGSLDPAYVVGLRREYEGPDLDESRLESDPIRQFHRWFDEAVRAGVEEPNAMVLATVDEHGAPRQRTVLLKQVKAGGFVFFTNYASDKAVQLTDRPVASLLFSWRRLHRQVIVSGEVTRVPQEDTDRYFATRPRGTQVAAWASRQSRVVADRAELDAAYDEANRRFGDVVPTPPEWGGYSVAPREVEFWQGRAHRMHDRLRFRRDEGERWAVVRLAP